MNALVARRPTTALLRIAAFPGAVLLEAGNPDLFRRIRDERVLREKTRVADRALADRIGRELLPRPDLDRENLNQVLRLRRVLHQGRVPSPCLLSDVWDVAASVLGPSSDLVAAVRVVGVGHGVLQDVEEELRAAVTAEEARLRRTPWQLVSDSPTIRAAVRQAASSLFDDIARRIAAGERWETKRMRRRSDYLWRQIDRGVTKPTPRGWFAHAGLVEVAGPSAAEPRFEIGPLAIHAVENLERRRRSVAVVTPRSTLAITPVHWIDEDGFEAWCADPASDSGVLREVRLRRTAIFDGLVRVLERGPVPRCDLASRLRATDAGDVEESLVRGVVDYLVEIGVLEPSVPFAATLTPWRRSVPDEVASPKRDRGHGSGDVRGGDDFYIDVYRRVAAQGSAMVVDELASLHGEVLRILRAMAGGPAPTRAADADPGQVALLDALRRRVRSGRVVSPRRVRRGWPEPTVPDCAYGRLIGHVRAGADRQSLTLMAADLDGWGLPPASAPEWPLDCLVRLVSPSSASGPFAGVDTLFPAGALDARFADGIRSLFGEADHHTWYREFLLEMERLSGFEFVEVLVPPLTLRAANATRRPPYARAWTGDPDIARYCGRNDDAEYIPLSKIGLRTRHGRTTAVYGQRPIWPIYHTTRSATSPWSDIVTLLLAAAPRPVEYVSKFNLQRPFDAFAGYAHLPRISVNDRLVLSCEQWRMPCADFWDVNDGSLQKARRLEALRDRLALPRWIYVLDTTGTASACCDLESLRSVRTIDRHLVSAAGWLTVSEALPTPQDPPIRSADGSHNGELMLRLPMHRAAAQFARDLMAEWAPADAVP